MAHESQERYSNLVLAKLRQESVLKVGVVFNKDYEGSPAAGLVKIPVRDTEVAVSDYDRANGIKAGIGSTSYENFVIDKDKAVNEIIDGYDAATVPDNLVADRLDSAGYSLALQEDNDGASVLIAGSTPTNVATLTKDNIYSTIVDIRTAMNKANIPINGRYLLVTPETSALILNAPEFIKASALGDTVVQTGAIGKIAGFLVLDWNDSTANLAMIAGHPKFATRAEEFKVGVHIQDLGGSGQYIGASAVQGRMAYGHKVLRSVAIRTVYSPAALTVSLSAGSAKGKTVAAVSAGNTGTTYQYKVNPSVRAAYGTTSESYGGTELTSGTTEITAAEGSVIEVANISSGKVVAVGYITVKASDIKA